jgi:hypothetical protein
LGYDFPEPVKIEGGCFDVHSDQIGSTTGRGPCHKMLDQTKLFTLA